MSSYLDFYKVKQNCYTHLLEYSRNSDVYQAFRDILPYGKLRELTKEDIDRAVQEVRAGIASTKDTIHELKVLRDKLPSFCAATLDERVDRFLDIKTEIAQNRVYLEEQIKCAYFLEFVGEIVECDRGDREEGIAAGVYAGFEAPAPST